MASQPGTVGGGFKQFLSKKFAALAGSLYTIYFVWDSYAEMVEANVPLLEWPTVIALLSMGIASAVYFLSQTWPDVWRVRLQIEQLKAQEAAPDSGDAGGSG